MDIRHWTAVEITASIFLTPPALHYTTDNLRRVLNYNLKLKLRQNENLLDIYGGISFPKWTESATNSIRTNAGTN